MGALLRLKVPPSVDHSERSEAQRNCVRVTERGEEAWSVSCEPMDKNRIEGVAEQGERARNREALVIKAKWR